VCRVCRGTVLLKCELAWDLKYARQQVTAIGFMNLDSWMDKHQTDVALILTRRRTDWPDWFWSDIFYSLLQQMRTISHSVNFSVELTWIAFITESNKNNVAQQLLWADKSRVAVRFSQFFSRHLFGHFKRRSPWREWSLRPQIVTCWTIYSTWCAATVLSVAAVFGN